VRVYIAGPMTGYPEYNYSAFSRAAADWQREGWDVVTPFECNSVVWRRHHDRDFDPALDACDYGDPILGEMLLEDVRALVEADGVAFLRGWEKSKGANLEYRLATALGKRLYHADTFLPLAEPSESILAEADRLVSGDRQGDYGHPIEDFTRTGRMWGAILGTPDVPPDKVAMCMVALKLSRECNKPKRDNRTDAAGYVKTLELVRERQGLA
jgi:hypothetical protein